MVLPGSAELKRVLSANKEFYLMVIVIFSETSGGLNG